MASKRKNYAKCKVWGENIIAEIEGTVIGCMENMLLMLAPDLRQRAINHLQAAADKATHRCMEDGNAA